MMERKLPKLYAPVMLQFSTLRTFGGSFDNDVIVTRKCMRVRDSKGWHWQIIGINKMLNEFDYCAEQDQEILLDCGSGEDYIDPFKIIKTGV